MNIDDLTPTEFSAFAGFLERQCGIMLSDSKRYLVRSRLMPLVRSHQKNSLSELIDTVIVGRDIKLRDSVIDAMTTNETLWFRDKYPFDILSNTILPSVANKPAKVRIWSAACSSGQEPYSIAMLVKDYQNKHPGSFPAGVEIIATDISSEMLERARSATYDPLCLGRGLPDEFKRRYFTLSGKDSMQIVPQVSKMVTFRPLNLLDAYHSLGRFDVVFCRNVLIYFSVGNKRKILQQIAACLQNQGALFLGASESNAESTDFFTMIRHDPGLYYQKK